MSTAVDQPLAPGEIVAPRLPPRDAYARMRRVITVVTLLGVTVFTFWQLHPDLIVKNTTPTGGDMGAHVWGPAFLRDHILPGWTNGWSMDWYGGLPTYRYYMVIPALMMVALDVLLPYAVAFKIVAVLGIVTLPVCAWAFGRLARFPWPVPELFALAALVFLFDETFTIYGGNIASTMAGEFSFSIALSLAVLGFGLFSRVMQDGTHRAAAAVVIALSALSHGIVLFFVFGGTVMLLLVWADRERIRQGLLVVGTAVLLAGFWVLPFVFGREYMTDMKYEPKPNGSETWWQLFFPHTAATDRFWTVLAVVGFAGAVARRHRGGTFLGTYALVITASVYIAKGGIPIIGEGLLWNPRLLPFLHLLRYLLGFLGIVELVRLAVSAVEVVLHRRGSGGSEQQPLEPVFAVSVVPATSTALPGADGADDGDGDVPRRQPLRPHPVVRAIALGSLAVIAGLVTVGWTAFHLGELPGQRQVARDGKWWFEWGPITASADKQGFVDGWANWNFSGYEGKPAYGEYYRIVQRMKAIGLDPAYGCGRALWENNNGTEKYGTPMALMLLPFWTDGCIGSMEGLFFEAAGSTPYHFLTAAAMSSQSSNPVRELRYANNDASVGVPHLQALGVRYYLAFTPEAIAQAAQQPDLVEIAREDPWVIYEVLDSDLVVPLTVEPVVVQDRPGDPRERWLELGTSWLQNRSEWPAVPVADGPDAWQRVRVEADPARRIDDGRGNRRVDIVQVQDLFTPRELEPVKVSDVVMTQSSVSFTVDRVGVPILVKVSYYPNWTASGADGPYRSAPNYMVVVPTEETVTLRYGRTGIDYLSMGLSLGGALLAVALGRGRARYRLDGARADRLAAADPFGVALARAGAARPLPPASGAASWDVSERDAPPPTSIEAFTGATPDGDVALPPFPVVAHGDQGHARSESDEHRAGDGHGRHHPPGDDGRPVPLAPVDLFDPEPRLDLPAARESGGAESRRPLFRRDDQTGQEWPVSELLPFDDDDGRDGSDGHDGGGDRASGRADDADR